MKTFLLSIILLLPLIPAQIRCPSGKFLTPTGNCELCPRGTHRRENPTLPPDSPCIPCPRGTFSPGLGAWGPDLCRECQPNTFSDKLGAKSCLPCPPGTSSRFRARKCITCGPGTQVSKDSTRCSKCRKGFYGAGISNQRCKACPEGMTSPRGAKSQDECIACAPGQGSTPGLGCTRCASGWFSLTGVCMRCPPGSFSTSERSATFGPTSCTLCSPGEFQNREGQEKCKSCDFIFRPGTAKGFGNTFCKKEVKPCGKSRFKDALGDCRRCLAGYRLNLKRKKCQKCPEGTVSRGGVNTRCIRCKNGQIPDKDRAVCACPKGNEIDTNGGCRSCLPGFAKPDIGTRCSYCYAGEYSDKPGSVRCKKCPYGSIAAEDMSTRCVPCPKDTVPHYDRLLRLTSTQCLSDSTNCRVGYVRENVGRFDFRCRKVICTLDTPPEEIGKTCIACKRGKRFNTTTGTCDGCASECRPCLTGIPITVCVTCSSVESSAGGLATECKRCPQGQFQDHRDGSKCSCYGEDGRGIQDGVCKICEAGTFGAGYNQSCMPCPPGTFSNQAGAVSCKACAVDTFSDVAGAKKCRKCPDGMISNFRPGGTKCVPEPM